MIKGAGILGVWAAGGCDCISYHAHCFGIVWILLINQNPRNGTAATGVFPDCFCVLFLRSFYTKKSIQTSRATVAATRETFTTNKSHRRVGYSGGSCSSILPCSFCRTTRGNLQTFTSASSLQPFGIRAKTLQSPATHTVKSFITTVKQT